MDDIWWEFQFSCLTNHYKLISCQTVRQNWMRPRWLVIAWQRVKQASPLPQTAHVGVSGVQRVAQTNQEAGQQQEGGALQRRHDLGGRQRTDFTDGWMEHQHFRKEGTRTKHILIRSVCACVCAFIYFAEFVNKHLLLQFPTCFSPGLLF